MILRGTEVQKMMWVFHMFDENDDGTIEIEEIERILAGKSKRVRIMVKICWVLGIKDKKYQTFYSH